MPNPWLRSFQPYGWKVTRMRADGLPALSRWRELTRDANRIIVEVLT